MRDRLVSSVDLFIKVEDPREERRPMMSGIVGVLKELATVTEMP